jgi:post-segregation antitoxin (ccd killing protein)
MRKPAFEGSAPKRTVSLTLNSDLYANAKSAGINISKVAEDALAVAYVDQRRAKLAAEIQADIKAAENYAESHGAFADFVREHYERDDNAV